MVREALSLGYSITVPGRTAVIAEAIKYGDGFMVESDFPGVEIPRALRPWDLAAAEEEALRGTPDPEKVLRRINVEAVVRAYGVEPP
jgi:predicted urease superfamily metal-dependent hydrolase